MESITPYLLKQIEDGKVVLFLGAGASMDAKTNTGLLAPSANDLKDQLSDKFLGGKLKSEVLSTVAELSISEADLYQVQLFIREKLLDLQPCDHHLLMPTFRWHGIATTNYDTLAEKSYDKISSHQKLRPIISNQDRLEDYRRSPADLLYLKLHGCINRINDNQLPLILTPDQYITHRENRSRLFDIFSEWAREKIIIFIGSQLQDYDLRAIILEVTKNIKDRPPYFLVKPNTDDVIRRFWMQQKVTVIDGTMSTFFQEIDRQISGMARGVAVEEPDQPIQSVFRDPKTRLSEAASEICTAALDFIHPGISADSIKPVDFYKGFSIGWGPIQAGLDFKRNLEDQILSEVIIGDDKRGTEVAVIRGHAGSGKSIFMRRLAWNAAHDLDAICIYANDISLVTKDILIEIVSNMSDRLFLFIDHAALYADHIAYMIRIAKKRDMNITFVLSERSNEWNMYCDSLEGVQDFDYQLNELNANEAALLLDKLEEHQSLGTLAKHDQAQRVELILKSAKRQLLVALHEATLGRPFVEIVKDEYERISPELAQSLYLTICTLNRTGIPVRAGLISRVHGITFDKFKRDFMLPLEHVVFSHPDHITGDLHYRARHQHVAELVFRQAFSTQHDRFERISLILRCLILSYKSDRIAFRQIINANRLKQILTDEILVSSLYELAEELAPEDGHVYLQRAIFERRNRDDLSDDHVDKLLQKAQELLPTDRLVRHQRAELFLDKARATTNRLLFDKYLNDARDIIHPLITKSARDSYGYHTAIKIDIEELKQLLHQPDIDSSSLSSAIKKVESSLSTALQKFPNDSSIIASESELAKLLDDQDRALRALEDAVSVSIKNRYLVSTLARHYIRQDKKDKAIELLEKAVTDSPFHQDYNLLLAKTLIEVEGDPLLIEKYSRNAFSEGDENYFAQLIYARQLYINGKIQESKQRFKSLERESIPAYRYRKPILIWTEGNIPKVLLGTVKSVSSGYIFIERDVYADDIFAPSNIKDGVTPATFSRGDRVKFNIAFNDRGPVATMVIKQP